LGWVNIFGPMSISGLDATAELSMGPKCTYLVRRISLDNCTAESRVPDAYFVASY